jgi:NTP pyrophosphatase (non-canonical NTP hydrolase)
MTDIIDVTEIKKILQDFAFARDWNKFHNPKNLSMALACETGELLEIFQWLTQAESSAACNDTNYRERTAHELADIIIYAIRLADLMNINLNQAIRDKIEINNVKYPADLVRGSLEMYDEYHTD